MESSLNMNKDPLVKTNTGKKWTFLQALIYRMFLGFILIILFIILIILGFIFHYLILVQYITVA